MTVVFWLAVLTVVYTYVGYMLLLLVQARVMSRPILRAPCQPTISIIIAAHNEAERLPGKLVNLAELDYPADRVELVIVSDGSTDGTNDLLLEHARLHPDRVRLILLPAAGGKAVALNAGVLAAQNELLVFMDARQRIDPDALRQLTASFSDPSVGAVSGELLLAPAHAGAGSSDAVGIYWKIEKAVRRLESTTGSVVGVTGALYALRRSLYQPLPAGTLLDDVWVPMHAARAGYRILFEPLAVAHDQIFSDPGKEFQRKVRTLTGNYQLLRLAPWLLSLGNPLLFRFISHKLLRLAVPFLLILILVLSALIPGLVYRVALAAQVIFYGLAAMGFIAPGLRRIKPVAIATTFTVLNLAAALALFRFARGRAAWT